MSWVTDHVSRLEGRAEGYAILAVYIAVTFAAIWVVQQVATIGSVRAVLDVARVGRRVHRAEYSIYECTAGRVETIAHNGATDAPERTLLCEFVTPTLLTWRRGRRTRRQLLRRAAAELVWRLVLLLGTVAAAAFLVFAVSWTWAMPVAVIAVYQAWVWKTRTLLVHSYFLPGESLVLAGMVIGSGGGWIHIVMLAVVGGYVLWYLVQDIVYQRSDDSGQIVWNISDEDPTAYRREKQAEFKRHQRFPPPSVWR